MTEDWKTLEQQIIALWKTRGIEVLDIEVEHLQKDCFMWKVMARKKEDKPGERLPLEIRG